MRINKSIEVLLWLAVLACILMAIWTGDGRWWQTAVALFFPAFTVGAINHKRVRG